jgi:hypothetical protein
MRLFHYTVGDCLADILSDGYIKLATDGFDIYDPEQKPAAWFTTKPSWESTCNKMWRIGNEGFWVLNEEETEVLCEGLFRIEVYPNAAPFSWRDFKAMAGGTPRIIRGLYKSARDAGARPDVEWRVSFEPVTSEHWLCIEKKNGQRWEVIWKRGDEMIRIAA